MNPRNISGEVNGFQFSRPEVVAALSSSANAAVALGALAGRMAEEKRTSVYRRDGERENNAEHSFMLAKVAPAITQILLPHLNHDLVASFADLHDDVEAYVGDTPTDRITPEARVLKQLREGIGHAQLAKEFEDLGDYADLVNRYELQVEPEARAVRMIDKIMPFLIHINDNAEGLLRLRQSADELRQNAALESVRLRKDYGHDMGMIIDLRDELAEYTAQLIESRPEQYLF